MFLLFFIYLSHLSKNNHFRKNSSINNEHLCTPDTAVKTKIENIPTNNIQLCTVDTAVSKRIQTFMETNASELYPYRQAGAHAQTKINVTLPPSI
jgi:hypothetical protein